MQPWKVYMYECTNLSDIPLVLKKLSGNFLKRHFNHNKFHSQLRHVDHYEISDQSDHHIVPHINTCCILYVGRSEFTSFEAFWWIKMSWISNFFKNYFLKYYIDVRWWSIGKRKDGGRGGGYNTLPPISLSNIFYTN